MQDYDVQNRDPHLWEIAKKRASFKSHFFTYLAIMPFFWLIWWFTGAHNSEGLPWPVWPTAGWGIGVFFHYLGAYVYKDDAVQKEYEKLQRERKS